jgi:hypothetical protein
MAFGAGLEAVGLEAVGDEAVGDEEEELELDCASAAVEPNARTVAAEIIKNSLRISLFLISKVEDRLPEVPAGPKHPLWSADRLDFTRIQGFEVSMCLSLEQFPLAWNHLSSLDAAL